MRLHNAYKWPFWEHIIDHISKTGNVSSLKFSGEQDLPMPFCITLIKCSFMTEFFCSIDIIRKNLNQHQYSVLTYSNIMQHFDNHNVLCDNQHGFGKRRSCETQLDSTIQELSSSIAKGKQVDVILRGCSDISAMDISA